jgi:1-phosphofructokinase family hexose kinase
VITVLSLNTAIDRTLLIPHFQTGDVFRAQRAAAFAGGKGLNVARVLRRLQRSVRVIGFLGGLPAPFIRARCDDLGIEQRWISIEGESRTCVIVVDPHAGGQTVLNEPGPSIGEEAIQQLRATIDAAVQPGDILCISGSAPPGVPDDFYAGLIRSLQAKDIRVLADVAGKVLRLAAARHPWALSPNLDEAAAAFAMPASAQAAAARLMRSAEHALITLGADGVLYAGQGEARFFRPPPIRPVNAVGSGDAFVAGFLAGIEEGYLPRDAVRLAVACGAANACRLEPDIGGLAEVRGLMEQVREVEVSAHP